MHSRQVFHLFLVKLTRYDERGYPIMWWRSVIPSNSLAAVNALALDAKDRRILGDDVDIELHPVDETNRRFVPARAIAEIRRGGGKALIALVGVQTNQFPRALDLARPFLKAGLPVCIGGFHVSGCYSMLKTLPPEIVTGRDMGISYFLGEAEEGRLDEVVRDAYEGKLKPVYDHLKNLPALNDQPGPFLHRNAVTRTFKAASSFDVGRGCPFECSFCTIINVQGRRSRFRTGADLRRIIKQNIDEKIFDFFVTDDNLARNKNWQELFDTLIDVQREEKVRLKMTIQVDTLCHKIPHFIDKAVAAGVDHVFIGLENINPDNLLAAKKKQNRITDYREMLLAWKKHPVMISAGYIVGFPHDTKAALLNDIEIIKRELPIDFVFFNNLTPLPGCEDHKKLYEAGVWMDPDLNKYDLLHRVTHHPKMSDEEWDSAYDALWRSYYSHEHMVRVMRRVYGLGSNKAWMTMNNLVFVSMMCKGYFKSYRMEWGILPLRYRNDRRSGMPKESIFTFYPRQAFEFWLFGAKYLVTWLRLRLELARIRRDPNRTSYRDTALTPPSEGQFEELDLYTATRGADAEIAKARARIHDHKAA